LAVVVFETKAQNVQNKEKEIKDDIEKFNCKDVKRFNTLYWLMLVMMMSSSTILWSFLDVANKWINLRFGIDEIRTAELISYSFAF
jgi:hypothetical protein